VKSLSIKIEAYSKSQGLALAKNNPVYFIYI
jgi:hypothetical protein